MHLKSFNKDKSGRVIGIQGKMVDEMSKSDRD